MKNKFLDKKIFVKTKNILTYQLVESLHFESAELPTNPDKLCRKQ